MDGTLVLTKFYGNKNEVLSGNIMDDVIKNLYKLFDAAWEINMSGNGTDITRMVTTFVPDAIQNLQAYEDMFKNMERQYDHI